MGQSVSCLVEADAPHFKSGANLVFRSSPIFYIGRCYDSFGKRVNKGYGKIHPKNCCIDGQSTNCHLNALIESEVGNVKFCVCALDDDSETETQTRACVRLFLKILQDKRSTIAYPALTCHFDREPGGAQ